MEPDRVTTPPLASPMSDVEQRMSLVPLESLLAEREAVVKELAPLWAKWGPGGVGDDVRKAELSRLKGMIRAQAARDGRKGLTNGQIDDEAHAHPDYLDWLALATTERARCYVLQARVAGIEFVVNRGQMVGKYLTAELHLAPQGA